MTNRLRPSGDLPHAELRYRQRALDELYCALGELVDLVDARTPELIFDVGDNELTVAVSSGRNEFVRARKRIEYLQRRAPGDDW